MTLRPAIPAAFVVLLLCGCSMERHNLSSAGVNQTVQVESGDRLFMELEEDVRAGYRWQSACADHDVTVTIRHAKASLKNVHDDDRPGTASVEIRIHRGYDGPSVVTFFYVNPKERTPVKRFMVSLFKRTGDEAFWK